MHCSSRVIYSLAENLKYCGSTVQWKTLEVKIQKMRKGFLIVGIIVWKMTHLNKYFIVPEILVTTGAWIKF